ncbi:MULTISPECIES: aerobic respiration two-component sensor histidine kinase ArcB [Alteromonadaceae]|jgi:two-component system aerobic respiration control sensor histidine kinase ArcB|uniref:Aerobic respiration control sensor protein n=1 Tax=Brumicola blandensis TaxID=3075611 RepID=A0AAW8R6Q4_9ALTE|nr:MULTISPECIES: aerobic respiration two-component sensor histidine kinase ArcB [unclassified Alteromonas]MDT0584122.1 aerobic respiration two-component sensor histidine kinase ArcB [Alteromonas sp. W409]MDT0629035.1 aerobic respiration two-component sensor histidine kinase ArcB [Alteromonas sp. W364]
MHLKSPNESWAIKFAQFVDRFGTLKISILFVVFTLLFTLVGSYIIRSSMGSQIEIDDFISALILTMLSAPWLLYFFSELIKQLEHSRINLEDAVSQLERLRKHDVILNRELQNNIRQLNYEIEQRRNAQLERESVFEELEREIKKKSEQEMQARRLSTLTRSIIDASPDLIYYRNEEGRFAGCNRVAEEVTGKTEEELLGLTPHQVYDESLARQVAASDNEVLETNASLTEELWLKFADGRSRYFEMRKVPFFDQDGHRLGLLAFGRDMTERKQAESAIAQASKDKTKFIATISHELRTPLNGIVGLSRMLRDTKLSKEQFDWVSTIYASAITLGNIFNDIIDLDKLDRDKIEIDLKTVNLRDFTNEISSIIRLLAQDKNLTFQSEIIEPIPVAIEADGTRLRQVLWNILFNALKFTPKGEVTLVVEARDEGAGNSTVTFRINDTGVGIPQDDIDKIFAMYYQVDHPDHQSATGTGIGLAICKQMVDKMNGDIRVHSVVGQGTCFEIVLPVAISKQQARMAELEVSNLNILLVEDIELNVMVAKALLEKLGQRVEVAMTGTAAIEMARKTQYDLILLDIQLPDMTGFDVARTLHDEELVLQTPIVALTANVIKKREEYLQNGMDDIIAKPIKKSRVIEVFNELFGEDQLQSERPSASEVVSIPKVDKILDIDMLQMLIDTIGEDMVRTSLGVFQEKIPEYMELLKVSLAADEKSDVCSEAHKIKGAAGSVGLSRVQKTANKIQQGDHPTWWENVHDWVEELEMAIEQDVEHLLEWVNANKIDD